MITQDLATAFEKNLAGLSQEDFSRGPNKKLDSKLGFKLLYLHAYCRLRHMQTKRCGRKRSGFCNRSECP